LGTWVVDAVRERAWSLWFWFAAGRPRQRGQGLVEYALILVLVAIVVIGVLTTMGTKIQAAFQDIVNKLGG
jgi:pilus assembly protein Flp/PilA